MKRLFKILQSGKIRNYIHSFKHPSINIHTEGYGSESIVAPHRLIILFTLFFLLAQGLNVYAEPQYISTKLSWDYNVEDNNIYGYNVYYSTIQGQYFITETCPKFVDYTLNYKDLELEVGCIYYFVVTALNTVYDSNGKPYHIESEYSNEVFKDLRKPEPPDTLMVE